MHREGNPAKREAQSVALLQKLIRIDSKDCHFHFKDDLHGAYFKVSYPQTNTDNNSNDALLRQLWHHVNSHYFKRIDPDEKRRLAYVRNLFLSAVRGGESSFCWGDGAGEGWGGLWEQMGSVYSDSYLESVQSIHKWDKQAQVWLKWLLLQGKAVDLQRLLSNDARKKNKLIYSKLKQNRKQRRVATRKKALAHVQKLQLTELDEAIEELNLLERQNQSEIEREIRAMEMQLAAVGREVTEAVRGIESKIEEEAEEGEVRFGYRGLVDAMGDQGSKDLECLQYLIGSLQQKQVAESVSKIISTQRANGEIMFQITYEKAINIEPRLVTEKQLSRINFLRETSLVHFYRTGVKSLYSYICHNYVGFRELKQNRLNITAKIRDKCMIQMMKKGACLASVAEIQQEMAKFNTCHHCKFLFPDYLLFTCKFSSDKQAIPKINLEATCDPSLAQPFQDGLHKNRTSQRFMTRKKNCLTSYAKIHDEYICGRKYCGSCLKDTYAHENISEHGLCPFCLGVCICTRCLRNEKIAKFKNMYSLLGGDLSRIQEKSDLEQLPVRAEEQLVRGRGRPKKYAVTHVSINTTQKKLRRFEEKENEAGKGLALGKKGLALGKKAKRKSSAYALWKRNDSGNDTQEEVETKRRKKRVGRPRNHPSPRLNPPPHAPSHRP